MFGSTIIVEKDPSRLKTISDVEDLTDFVCLELDTLATIDFETIIGNSDKKWTDGTPILFDEDAGMALFNINEEGLLHVLSQGSKLNKEQAQDHDKLAEFVRTHGSSDIYEFTTF